MTYKPSGKKVTIVCEECGEKLNGKPIYTTIENPRARRLCKLCMAKWLDLEEFP